MYRLATLLALLVVALAGCGGGSDDASKPSSPAAADAAEDRARADDADSKDGRSDSDDDADARKEKESADSDEAKSKASEKSRTESVEDALTKRAESSTPAQVRYLIRTVVIGTIGAYSLRLAGLEIGDKGRDVNVLITRKSACYAIAKEEHSMAEKIRDTTRIVRSVRFEVAGTGQELGEYVLGCKRPAMPDGPGKTVFEKTAVGGPVTTKPFTIKGDRWAIEYENLGNSLAVIVIPVSGKGKDKYHEPIGAQKPTAGRHMYKHSGKYMLKIHGPALWTVRVKDIR